MDKTLVVYFSGNQASSSTKEAAKAIADLTGSELFSIECLTPYAEDHSTVIQEAIRDKDANARPLIKQPLPEIDEVDTLFIGFPNWCGTAPMPVFTFLDSYEKEGKLSGKNIYPFVINDGSGIQNIQKDLSEHYPNAVIHTAQSIQAGDPKSAGIRAVDWIQNHM